MSDLLIPRPDAVPSGTELPVPHVVGGRAVAPPPGAALADLHDPATGRRTGRVALDDVAAVDAAVDAAVAAFPAWAALPAPRRVAVLRSVHDRLTADLPVLARLVSAEHGKVHADAVGELHRGLEVLDHALSAPLLLRGEFSDQVATGVDVHSMRLPLGVVAGITPFNFPAMIPLWMFPIALACGNTFVLKPSERDPSVAVRIAELALDAGLPDGVLNVVHGGRPVVEAILAHRDIAAVSFVGSTAVARHIYATAAANGKRVQAFGGAKNHMVVLPDANLDTAADALVSGAYGSTGQRCMAVAVAVAVGDVGDDLVERVRSRAVTVRVGAATDLAAEIGPLTTADARRRVRSLITAAEADGCRLVLDGRDLAHDGDGFFVGPTLVDGAAPGMSIYDEEVFGPVLVVVRVPDLDAALDLVNDSPYGNGAIVFTADGRAARRFAREAQAGMIGVNVPIPVPVPAHGFGGWKGSAFGDQHMYGTDAFRFYTRTKVVTSRWPTPHASATQAPGPVDLAFPTDGH